MNDEVKIYEHYLRRPNGTWTKVIKTESGEVVYVEDNYPEWAVKSATQIFETMKDDDEG